jgi:hypothetical protein
MRKIWLRRFAWFVLLWIASVSALALVALFFRLVMKAGGLTS